MTADTRDDSTQASGTQEFDHTRQTEWSFEAQFTEHTDRSQLSPLDAPNNLPMPEAEDAARAVDLMLATFFDLYRGTRIEPAAPQLTTGMVLALATSADRARREWHSATDRLRDLQENFDGSEVATVELEEQTIHAPSLEELYNVACAMQDRAIAAWEAETGRAFVTSKRASILHAKHTASFIDSADYLRGMRQRQRDAITPEGPIVIFSGGTVWHDINLIAQTLDAIKARVPNMVLATTGQQQGADLIALHWARQAKVHVVAFQPNWRRHGKAAGFRRCDQMLALKHIVEAVLCEGSQNQVYLYERLSKRGVPLHCFNTTDQAQIQPSRKRA